MVAVLTPADKHMSGRGLRAYLDECRSVSGMDSSPLILFWIEEERKRMRQRERAVFCLSLYASALKH
jgi:hypothetical protein